MNKTINFYVATKPREAVGRIYLTGGSSRLPGLKERIEEETGIDVEYLNPFLFLDDVRAPGVDEESQFFMAVALYLSSRISDSGLWYE